MDNINDINNNNLMNNNINNITLMNNNINNNNLMNNNRNNNSYIFIVFSNLLSHHSRSALEGSIPSHGRFQDDLISILINKFTFSFSPA